MQQRQKCCLHCPGNWISSSEDRREDHSCRLPTYVRGNLKLSSLRKLPPEPAERAGRLRGTRAAAKQDDHPTSCYDRFAIAKKFHAENLEHQPLPDRVDDSVFKNVRPSNGGANPHFSSPKRLANGARPARLSHKVRSSMQYASALGCKTPTTNMDLAICWEAPLDPTYEPSRAVHIDGTDGGPAPAIFTLVEHEIPHQQTHRSPGKCCRSVVETYEAKFNNVKNRFLCAQEQRARSTDLRPICPESDEASPCPGNPCCHNCPEDLQVTGKHLSNDLDGDLCEELGSIHISEEAARDADGGHLLGRSETGRRKLQPLHLRNCSKCECRGDRAARKPREQRLVHSAYAATRSCRRNGLPTKITVPRPKTPYAKRSFCIDTLSPPFSIVNGCRDADYPEHWRLTSVYQQSYKNPRKQRGTILNYH